MRFEHTTSGLPERSLRPFGHLVTWKVRIEIKSQVCILCNTNKMAKTNLICLSNILEIVGIYNLSEQKGFAENKIKK